MLTKSGLSDVSIHEVSRRYGVAKTTVYRHWPLREAASGGCLLAAVVQAASSGQRKTQNGFRDPGRGCRHATATTLVNGDAVASSTRQNGIGTSRNCSRKFTHKCGEHSSPQSNALKNEASCPALKMRESWSLPSSAPFCTGVSSRVSRLTTLSQKRWSSATSAMLADLRLIDAEADGYTSKMISRAVGAPSGRLAAPYTKRLGFLSFPKTPCSSSEAPSATCG